MYDTLTSAALFLVLVPGVVLNIPPTGGFAAAVVHAIVFYLVQSFLPMYVPSWGIWIITGIVVIAKVWSGRSTATV